MDVSGPVGEFSACSKAGDSLPQVSYSSRLQFRRFLVLAAAFLTVLSAGSGSAATFELPGGLGVNQIGAATYSIPIDIPPGSAGMVPSLSLNYNSQGGNGILGVGWSLSGLSQITRCPETIAQDNFPSTVNNNAGDRLCIDGQRLMVVSGTYGAAGAVYRPEVDNLTKVVATGSIDATGTYYTATTRSGEIREYGNTATSPNSQVTLSSGVGVTWALDQVSDQAKNYYQVFYSAQTSNNAILPVTINYTGNANSGGVAPYNSITFGYTAVPAGGYWSYHQGGVQIAGGHVLTSIYTDIGTPANPGGTSRVSHYVLAYQQSPVTSREELISVKKCDVAGSCLPTMVTTFGWPSAPTGGPASFGGPTGAETGICSNVYLQSGDFDGDGRTDMICLGGAPSGVANQVQVALSNGDGTFTAKGWQTVCSTGATILLGDFDGDGKTDLLCNNPDTTHQVLLSKGDGTFIAKTATGPWCDYNSGVAVGDFNGDGRSDMICNFSTGSHNNNHAVALSNGDGTFTGMPIWTNSGVTWCDPEHLTFADFNGDGKTDMVCTGDSAYDGGAFNNQQIVAFSNGDGSFSSGSWQPAFCDNPSDIGYADFDGDGKTDMVCNRTSGTYQVAFSNGDGTFNVVGAWNNSGSNWCSSGSLQYADFNGDGRADLMCQNITTGTVTVAFSDGIGNFIVPSPAGGMPSWCSMRSVLIGDFNGDGQTDLICPSQISPKYLIALSDDPPDMIASVTTGLGSTSNVTYSPTFIGKGGSSSGAIYAVTDTAKDNGVGGQYIQWYGYSGAQTDRTGRGFQGFASVAVNDFCLEVESTNTQTTTNYNQNWPLTGTVSSRNTQHFIPSGTTGYCINETSPATIHQTTNTYSSTPTTLLTYSPWFVSLTQSVVTSRELDNADVLPTITTNYTYDSESSAPYTYGNVVQAIVSSNEGWQSVTCNTYSNNTTLWILGMVTETQTTGAATGTSYSCSNLPSLVRTTQYGHSVTTPVIIPGAVSSMAIESSGSTDYVHTAYGRDIYGNVLTTTTYGSNLPTRVTTLSYDNYGRFPATVENALSQTTTVTYDPNYGGMTSSNDPNSIETLWSYDTLGRKTNETRPDGTQTNWTYNAAAGCFVTCYIAVSATGAPPITAVYDLLERPVFTMAETFDGSGTILGNMTGYDALGRVSAVRRPYVSGASTTYSTTYTYDDIGRVYIQSNPDGGSIENDYGTTSLTGTSTNLSVHAATLSGTGITSRTSKTISNSLGEPAWTTDANSNPTYYVYDPFGNLLKTTDPLSNVVAMTYDVRGHMTSKADPDKGTTTYTSDALGEVLSWKDAKNTTATFTYDLLGRPLTETGLTPSSTWTYDTATNGIGKPATATTDGGYSRAQSYDSYGRPYLTTITIGGTPYLTSVSHDSSGRIATTHYPSGLTVGQTYNAQGYLNSLTNGAGGSALWTANTEDSSFNVTQETYGNGVVTNQGFDPKVGRILSTQSTGPSPGDVPVQYFTYTWDVAGNLTTRTDNNAVMTEKFTYDLLNRVTQQAFYFSGTPGATTSFAYDAIGNIICKTDLSGCSSGSPNYSYNASGTSSVQPHAVQGITGTVNSGAGASGSVTNPGYSYDAAGNMVSGGGRLMSYSGLSAPSCIVIGSSGGCADKPSAITFLYDSEHNRFQQTAPEGTTVYVAASGVVTEAYTPAGGSTVTWNNYLYANGQKIGVVVETAGSATQFYNFHSDHLGSVTAVTDSSLDVYPYSYDVWGKRRKTNGQGDATDLLYGSTSLVNRGYTGQEEIGDLALVNMNARLYDPQIGKFLSGDPMDGPPAGGGDWNRYAYVGNNPLNRTDPSGMDPPAPTGTTDGDTHPCNSDCGNPGTSSDHWGFGGGQNYYPNGYIVDIMGHYVGGGCSGDASSGSCTTNGDFVVASFYVAGSSSIGGTVGGIGGMGRGSPQSAQSPSGLTDVNGNQIDDQIVVTGQAHDPSLPPGFEEITVTAPLVRIIDVTDASYWHIALRHTAFPIPFVSQFYPQYWSRTGIYGLIGATVNAATGYRQNNGNINYTADLGVPVGLNQWGFNTTQMTVIVQPTGVNADGLPTGVVVTGYPSGP